MTQSCFFENDGNQKAFIEIRRSAEVMLYCVWSPLTSILLAENTLESVKLSFLAKNARIT